MCNLSFNMLFLYYVFVACCEALTLTLIDLDLELYPNLDSNADSKFGCKADIDPDLDIHPESFSTKYNAVYNENVLKSYVRGGVIAQVGKAPDQQTAPKYQF